VDDELIARTALVTGASRGIGRAIALELARKRAHVIALGRARDALEETRRMIVKDGGKCEVLVADLSERTWHHELDRLAPEVDVVVSNAASFAPYGGLEDTRDDDIERVLAINVVAPLLVVRHVLPGMKARQFGRIVCIGTIAAETGTLGQVAYASRPKALTTA
jgi:NAD(P)-dependent dehydrogenase (short-subunit alcohol dehydrogenase family)